MTGSDGLFLCPQFCYNDHMKTMICDNSWQEKWEEFVKEKSLDGGLMQSWAWGDFQTASGRKIIRLATVDDEENIRACAQLVRSPLPLGNNYLYCARGPVCEDPASLEFKSLLQEIRRQAARRGSLFVRMDPPLPDNPEISAIMRNLGLKFVGDVQPKSTLIIDLTKPEEELSAQMKSKTRYNVRVAQKHCLDIDEGPQHFDDFWRLMQKTAKRDRIRIHSKKHYQRMLQMLGDAGIMKLVVAKSEGKAVAANLVAIRGQWCVYLHGASDYDFRDKMAPYLLQWETMLMAKSRWCEYYDLWGADADRWPGVTRFKLGFAPDQPLTQYVGAWDMPIKYLAYGLYRLSKRITKR